MNEHKGIPNLDAMSAEELDDVENALRELIDYSHLKRFAMTERVGGRIDSALQFESQCQTTYDRLPAWAKW